MTFVASDFTSTVPVPYVDATGCHIPTFDEIYTAYTNDLKAIHGQDLVLDNSTMDGQAAGIVALALFNYATSFLAAYNSFSPATAQGVGLSSVVKTNGIKREVASYSTVDIVSIGQAGSPIRNPQIRDGAGNLWTMPDFVIPLSGAITVTATCAVLGAVAVPAGSASPGFWTIATPQQGWQSVGNPAAAALGAPVEDDPELRIRQSQSTMLPAIGVVDGIYGALVSLPNVARVAVYENDQAVTDTNGIPGHSISAVVDGGDAQAIAQAIAVRKLSAGTFGTASGTAPTGAAQIPRTIYFFRPIEPPITWGLSVRPLSGFTMDGVAAIQQALSNWTNALGIGVTTPNGKLYRVPISRAYTPALLAGTPFDGTFEIVASSLVAARDGLTMTTIDPVIAFNEAPECQPSGVTVTVLPS